MLVNQKKLNSPYGGKLVNLLVPQDAYGEMKAYASRLPSLQISSQSVNQLELIATGAFSPLDRFMNQEDYNHVLHDMRMANGLLFPTPLTLPVSSDFDLHIDTDIAIRNRNFELIAIMTIEEIYQWDRTEIDEHLKIPQYSAHPWTDEIRSRGSLNISGEIQVLQLPLRYDFPEMWLNPQQTRETISRIDTDRIIGLLPIETKLPDLSGINQNGLESYGDIFLLQIAAGMHTLGDLDYFVRTKIYQGSVKQFFPSDKVFLSLLPFVRLDIGIRDILLQAIIQKNYGASHVLVSQPMDDIQDSIRGGNQVKQHYSEELLNEKSKELGIKVLTSKLPSNGSKPSIGSDVIVNESDNSSVHGSQYFGGDPKNSWYLFQQDVSRKLAETQYLKGACIWFTGLSGSGKSTTAEILSWLILKNKRKVIILDGDVVRTHLSRGLGFSKNDRDINVRRIGFVASMLVDLGGIVICAVVSPYHETRQEVRDMIGNDKFVEVFVDTPLAVCEERDVKGMYAKARNGELRGFTGIDDPYEPPVQPEIILDTISHTPEQNAHFIKDFLIEQGIIHSVVIK